MLLKNLLFGVYLSNNAVKISCHKKTGGIDYE